VDIDLADFVCLINAPTADKPYGKLYTVQYLGNVVGGHTVRYLNAEADTLRKAAADSVVDGHAVWFGCDVGKMYESELGILDPQVYDYSLIYGSPFTLDKAGRLDYGHSRMTHAMVFTGVDLDDAEKPIRWRVENSGGTKNGDKGYLTMSDTWFDEYLYEVVVHRKFIPSELLKALDTDPVVLPPWDPMGALARSS
jgi:bleomycin hydrolase